MKIGDFIRVQWKCHQLIPKGDYQERNPIIIPIVGIYAGSREYGAPGGGFFQVYRMMIGHRVAEIQDDQVSSVEILSTPL